MGNATVIMLKCSPFGLRLLIYIIAVLFINSCVKQAEIPPFATNIIKHYQRLAVHASSPPWTKSKITVNLGDPILIVASGKVTTKYDKLNPRHINQPPFNKMYLKIGEQGYPFRGVDVDNIKLFRSPKAGD